MPELVCLVLAACGSPSHDTASTASEAPGVTADSVARSGSLLLGMPAFPDSVNTPAGRAAFVALHFWDAMDFTDHQRSLDPDFIEHNFSSFVSTLSLSADTAVADSAIGVLMKRASASPESFRFMSDVAASYLYDPNSPLRDEELYIMFLRRIVASPAIEPALRQRFEAHRTEVMKNRVGQEAADFAFVTREGERMTLKGALKGTPQTVLLFYDPDCEVCAAVESRMASSERLNAMIDAGELRIVAVDPFDADRDKWRAHAATLPQGWTVGYSPGGRVDDGEIYVIHATPSAYVIDSAGRILAKDLTDPSAL